MFLVDIPCQATIQPNPVISAMPGCCPAMDWPKPSLGKTGMKTSHMFLCKRCQPGAQQDDLTPSTLAGHRFRKGTPSQLERSCSWVCHLLSIPGLSGATLGELAGEINDETILHLDCLYSSGFNKHFNKRFPQATRTCQGVLLDQKEPLKKIQPDSRQGPHDMTNSTVLCWETVVFSWTEGRCV